MWKWIFIKIACIRAKKHLCSTCCVLVLRRSVLTLCGRSVRMRRVRMRLGTRDWVLLSLDASGKAAGLQAGCIPAASRCAPPALPPNQPHQKGCVTWHIPGVERRGWSRTVNIRPPGPPHFLPHLPAAAASE